MIFKKMKYLAAVFLMIFLSSGLLNARENSSPDETLRLNYIDISEKDAKKYYTPLFPVPGFQIQREFVKGESLPAPDMAALNVFEQHIIIDREKFIRLSSNAYDVSNRPYYLEIDLSRGYARKARQRYAAALTSDIFINSRDDEIETVFADMASNSVEIIDIAPIFSDRDDADRIEGFEFSYRKQRSPTYRAVRTTIQIGAGIGLGMVHYFYYDHINKVDWVYDYTWSDAKNKILDGWYWDPNHFNTNTLYHLYAGLTYYQIARSNDYGMLASFFWSVGASTFWEYIGEWREQVSTNDMILTPTLGAVTGEAFIQTAEYLERRMQPGFFREFCYAVLYPAGWINRKLDSMHTGNVRVRLYFSSPLHVMAQDKMVDAVR